MVGVAPALGRIAKRAVLQRGGGLSESPQTAPVIRTDKEGYLAGEVTAISGEGFSPFERVMLRVSHIDGTVEAGMGHDAWFVDADANGAFRASWSVNIHDTAGADLKLEAAGSSGLSAQTAFARTGRLALDRSSGAGSKARVTGGGFNSNELVTIKLDGSEHQSISALSDANGNISADLSLTSGNVEAGAFSIQATSSDSAMVLSLNCSPSGCTDADFLADFFVVRHQSIGGQPLIRDVPADKELTQMGRNVDATDYNIFMSWDGTDQWTGKNTGDACALFDTNNDANGNIDFAVCGQIINSKDGTKIFQTTASPFAFTCDNTLGNRCGTPVPYSTAALVHANIRSGTLRNVDNRADGSTPANTGNLITKTDPWTNPPYIPGGWNAPYDATLRMAIKRTFLPANARLVNLCSYPSAGSGANNNPFVCIGPTGGNGFMEIKKVVTGQYSDTPTFTFKMEGPTTKDNLLASSLSGWTTGGISLPVGTYSATEYNIPTGWGFTGASCPLATSNSGTLPATVSGIIVDIGSSTTCTFSNTANPGTLIVKIVVVNNYGGSRHAADFTFQVGADAAVAFLQDGADVLAGKNTLTKDAGTYNVTEPAVTGYTTTYDNCSNVALTNGGTQTCTITNDDQAGTLIVKKVVVNDNGGSKHATDFSFQVGSDAAVAFLQDGGDVLKGKNTLTKDAGTYTITEPAVAGYTTTYDNCSNVVLTNGDTQTCTISNDDQAGTLIVKKVVINDNGGSKHATDFTFQVGADAAVAFLQDGGDVLKGKNTLTKNAGTYTITEPAVAGYTTTYNNCSNVVLTNGGTQTCTITNDDQSATLIVNKVVNNTNGGTGKATDFSFQVNGGPAQSFLPGADDLNGSNPLSVPAGTYTITEPVNDGYAVSYSNCSNVVVGNGGAQTCTITNTALKGPTTQSAVLQDKLTITGLTSGGTGAYVNFHLYTDDVCTQEVGTPVEISSNSNLPIDANGVASTNTGVAVHQGTYYWRAEYSGDQYNGRFSTVCGVEVTTINDQQVK